MSLKQFASDLFGYRIKEGVTGWDEAAQILSKTGIWSLSASPRKFEKLILEMCKRIEVLEEKPQEKPIESTMEDNDGKSDTPVQPSAG